MSYNNLMYSYLLWFLIFVALPILFLWVWKGSTLKKYKRVFIFAEAGAIIFFFPWDYISIRERIWYFNTPHILGIWILGLPLEEWFFLIFETLLFTSVILLIWEKKLAR